MTFDLLTLGSVHAEVLPWTITSTDFGANGLSRFPFRLQTNRQRQTNRQMRLNALPHAGGYKGDMGNNPMCMNLEQPTKIRHGKMPLNANSCQSFDDDVFLCAFETSTYGKCSLCTLHLEFLLLLC